MMGARRVGTAAVLWVVVLGILLLVTGMAVGIVRGGQLATASGAPMAAVVDAPDPVDAPDLVPADQGPRERVLPAASRGLVPDATDGVPADSGSGPRIVWSKSTNHVWVLGEDDEVLGSYPVSDLDGKTPIGQYRVQGKTRTAHVTTSGVSWRLDHFVKFYKRCAGCYWIGFHAIPVSESGQAIQAEDDLGTDRSASHGCVRMAPSAAKVVYDFAEQGTRVVVLA